MCKRGRYRIDPVRQLAVGDRVETGEQLRGCPAGRRVGDELNGALPKCRPVGITVEDGPHDLWQPQLGRFNRPGDCLIRSGVGELLVCGGQVGDAARKPLFTGNSRHQGSSAKSKEVGAPRCAYNKSTLAKLTLFRSQL